MRLDVQDSDHLDTVTEPRPLPEVRDPAFEPASTGFGWLRLYSRPAGIIQTLYALFFGWLSCHSFRFGHFYHRELFGKTHHPEFYDYQWLITTTLCTLIFFSALIGGYGLLKRRPWARRWEVAYLAFLAVGLAAEMVSIQSNFAGSPTYFARSKPPDLAGPILFTLAFSLPFVPFVFGRVRGEAGAAQLRSPRKEVHVSVSDGVRDRELDG